MSQLDIVRAALILGTGALAAACGEQPAPVAPTVAPAAPIAKQIYLVVERGQSLDRIARDYRVAKQDIIAANQLKPPYELKPGTVLTLPAGTAQSAKKATAAKSAPPDPGHGATGSSGSDRLGFGHPGRSVRRRR